MTFRILLSTIALSALLLTSSAMADPSKISFWDTQRKGANQQNAQHRPEWYVAAGELGLDYVRILPDAWPAEGRDFLIGNADNFEAINETDLSLLIKALDEAERNRIKVVLTMVSLPGARWKQLNNDQDDARLWKDKKYHLQAFEFWRQLAARLKTHPAIVAYNPLNEPHPDRAFGFDELPDENFAHVVQKHPEHAGRPQPIQPGNGQSNPLRRSRTPPSSSTAGSMHLPRHSIIIDPLMMIKVLYAFHNPGPWQMVTYRVNKGRYAYPDRVPKSWNGPTESWTIDRLAREMHAVQKFSEQYDIPAHRIIASEFWYDRRLEGAAAYMADLIEIYNQRGWHWAFYAYRGKRHMDGTRLRNRARAKNGMALLASHRTGQRPRISQTERTKPIVGNTAATV